MKTTLAILLTSVCIAAASFAADQKPAPDAVVVKSQLGGLAAEDDHDAGASSKFFCLSSGTLEGEGLDARVGAIVTAISKFYESRKRIPQGVEELRVFCKKERMELYDLKRLSPVVLNQGRFSYSAYFTDGRLDLSHQGMFLSHDENDS